MDGLIKDRYSVTPYGFLGVVSGGTSYCSLAELRDRLHEVWDAKNPSRVVVWDTVIEESYELLDRREINRLCRRLDVP